MPFTVASFEPIDYVGCGSPDRSCEKQLRYPRWQTPLLSASTTASKLSPMQLERISRTSYPPPSRPASQKRSRERLHSHVDRSSSVRRTPSCVMYWTIKTSLVEAS